jgi:uncharacterized protein
MVHLDTCVIVFAKAPIAGQVKTRLIPALGQADATTLFKHMVEHAIRAAVHAESVDVQLWCSPDTHHLFFNELAEKFPITLHQQVGIDLGFRMESAFKAVLQQYHNVIIVGTDCPDIKTEDYYHVIELLNEHDVVITPALDGGYVLLALKRLPDGLFKGILWGGSAVYHQTISRLNDANCPWKSTSPMRDIDRLDDVRYLKSVSSCSYCSLEMRRFIDSLEV